MPDILLIDDNEEILSANASFFAMQGYAVTAVDSGAAAITCLNEKQFDCIVLDILLPDIDGYAICKAARAVTNVPIIFLSCLDEVDDKIRGLMTGGDDYMTKPYSLKELGARVHVLLRRDEIGKMPKNTDFNIDHHNRIVQASYKNALLSQKEYDLFMLLYENPMKAFSKEEILAQVWQGRTIDDNTVAVHIMRLRRKLDFVARYIGIIENEYGTGYRLIPPKADDS